MGTRSGRATAAMTRHDQFYLTLPSNSSMNYYPNNMVTNYTTHLPSTVDLSDGEWEVALAEAHYPFSFLTVGEGTYIKLVLGMRDSKGGLAVVDKLLIKVEPGNYSSTEELVHAINNHPQMKSNLCAFSYDERSSRVELMSTSSAVQSLKLSPSLALQFGYEVDTDIVKRHRSVRPANLFAGLPSHMYVYCDLVEPQLVGDAVAPLLKILNIDIRNYTYGANTTVYIIDPHYVPVIKTSFESVEIDLRDNQGRHLPFHFGTTCMKLHFRKERQRQ